MSRARILLVFLVLAVFALIVFKPKHRLPINAPVADSGAEVAGLQPHPIHELRSEDFHGGDHYLVRNLVAGPIEVDFTNGTAALQSATLAWVGSTSTARQRFVAAPCTPGSTLTVAVEFPFCPSFSV